MNRPETISRLKKCPSRFKSMLEAMTMVPPGHGLVPFADAYALINDRFPAAAPFDQEERALQLCLNMLCQESGSQLSEFTDYVWQLPQRLHQDPNSAIEDAIERYEEFRIARQKLSGLAKISQFDKARRQGMRKLLRYLNIDIDEQGEAQRREDWFTAAVNGVEVARIRECQVCGKIFWAGQMRLQGCSSRCLDILRKRNKRKRDAMAVGNSKHQRVNSQLSDAEKRGLVRQSLKVSPLERGQIAEKTKLIPEEVADVLRDLILESNEVSFEKKDDRRIYFLTADPARVVKLRQAERKPR